MLLTNNLTFAVLPTDSGWRTDLTTRFCEYFSHRLNGENFIERIIFPDTIDDAFTLCTTDYLLIQTGGHVITDPAFLATLERAAAENQDMVLGHIILAEDYLYLDERCMFINMILWREMQAPTYSTQTNNGPRFKVVDSPAYTRQPNKLIVSGTDKMYAPSTISARGVGLIVAQLLRFGFANALTFDSDKAMYLSTSSPYMEIHSETLFEKKFLAKNRSTVFAHNDDPLIIKNIYPQLVVCPAQGLKAFSLYTQFKPRKLVVYDINPHALKLQEYILSIDEPLLYGDIVDAFIADHPEVEVSPNWEQDAYVVVNPVKDVEIVYANIDAVSFEFEELVKSFDITLTAIFDLSDIFVYPFNFYKRPLYQVQGLFAELYSNMKSRTAPTHILGFAPGFKRMDALPGSHQTIIDAKIADSTEWMSPLPTREVTSVQQIETSGNVDNAPVLVQAPVQQSPIVAPVKQPIPVAPVVQTPVIQPTPQEIPKPQPQPVAQVYAVPKPIPQRIDIPAQFTELGYARENQKGITVLTKITDCEVFIAKFMYYVDTEIGTWSFKVSKVEGTRQMEFSTGHGVDSLLRHLNMPMKINARAAAKHL